MVEVDAKGNVVQSKLLCVVPSTAQYTQCSPVVEEADPILFEAKYRVCHNCLSLSVSALSCWCAFDADSVSCACSSAHKF